MKLAKKLSVVFMAAALAAAPVAATFVEPTAIVEAKEAAISDETLILDVGDTYKLKVTGMKKAKWSSSDKSVAKVNKKNGKVTAVGEGTATITAKKGKKSVSCTVTVYKFAVTLDKTTAEVYEGNDITLTATFVPETATPAWSSSDEAVATVVDGKVDALKAGKATITVEIKEGVSASCELTVLEAKEFDYDPANFSVNSTAIWYYGAVLDEEAEYYLDDVKLTNSVYPILDSETPRCNLFWDEPLSDGEHVFTIKKEGYKTFNYEFTYEAPKFEGVFVDFYGNGTFYNVFGEKLWVQINPELDGVEMHYLIDGVEVIPDDVSFNGDGCLSAIFDAPAAGTHTIEAFMGELKADKKEIVIE